MPVTLQQYEKSLAAPALCEQLRIRDLLDNVAIQIDGSFVAGYELSGVHSYYASDEMRNRAKNGLEALVRSLPERSMRMQVRFEITEGYGDLVSRYNREQRNESPVLQAVDRVHADLGAAGTATGCTSVTYSTRISSGTQESTTSRRTSSGRKRCGAQAPAFQRPSASSGRVASTRTSWRSSTV